MAPPLTRRLRSTWCGSQEGHCRLSKSGEEQEPDGRRIRERNAADPAEASPDRAVAAERRRVGEAVRSAYGLAAARSRSSREQMNPTAITAIAAIEMVTAEPSFTKPAP